MVAWSFLILDSVLKCPKNFQKEKVLLELPTGCRQKLFPDFYMDQKLTVIQTHFLGNFYFNFLNFQSGHWV